MVEPPALPRSPTATPEARLRPRRHTDLAACATLVGVLRRTDWYPPYFPGGDARALLLVPGALGAWVAEQGGAVVGHVALHRSSSPEVMDRARQTLDVGTGDLAVVARLMVAPGARRRGLGRRLLEVATAAAERQGRRAVLDVAARFDAAVRLYASCGWIALGEVTTRLPDGTDLAVLVFASPPATP